MSKILSALFLLSTGFSNLFAQNQYDSEGALIRSDISQKKIYFIFSGHDFYEGFDHVLSVLDREKVKASFFVTGDFVRNHLELVKDISSRGHFIGAHSDKHLLYNDWENRDSLLVSSKFIKKDIADNILELEHLGISPKYFLPPYEWYNKEVVKIAKELDQITINFSPGTRSSADYTTSDMENYLSTEEILKSIFKYEEAKGMNGFYLLIHPGTSKDRKDKLYLHLETIIQELKNKGYEFSSF